MENKLPADKRKRLEELLSYANEHGEDYAAQIAKLALDLDDKAEYNKFKQVFSDNI